MALVIDRLQTGELADNKARRRSFWAISWLLALFRPDEALNAILAKKNDRLLTDTGLKREDLTGPTKHFWQAWARVREPWQL